jgi:hypothetical protein
MKTFRRKQRQLRKRYGISESTPIRSFAREVEESLHHNALKRHEALAYAETSGTSDQPKRIPFTHSRIRDVKFAFVDMFARCCWSLSLSRTSLYVFSSFNSDNSLTSLLLKEADLPSYLSTLQAPYRLQCFQALQALADRYGPTAVRLWILTIANPGILYSTNPSTLATFLEEVEKDWLTSSQLIRDWVRNPKPFDVAVTQIAKRLESRGCQSRLQRIANSEVPLSFESYAPAVHSYICWTGGYVTPFLSRIEQYLPASRYRLIPMYSMSTETIETIAHFQKRTVSFIPLARHVLYEFIELGKEDLNANVLSALEVESGKRYSMIVSDKFGLKRYQTEDLFRCCGKIDGLPYLTFVGRRGVEYSFTGEKLTLDHVSKMIQILTREYEFLRSSFVTLIPSQLQPSIPHYKLVVVSLGARASRPHIASRVSSYGEQAAETAALPVRCDQLLSDINCEYKAKRASGRLGPVQIIQVSMDDFLNKMNVTGAWEAQFKFLPFYRREWA